VANRVTIIVNADGTAAIEGIERVEGSTRKLGNSTQDLERRTRGITGQMKKHWLGVSAAVLGTYFAVKKAMDIGETFLRAADTTEQFETRLRVLLGSASEGNRLFEKMSEYASKVPFEFEEIMESATALSGIMKGGTDEIVRWMPMIGDLAAASGLGIRETTEQVIRMYSAGAGAADLFRERGVLAMMGFQAGVSYSAEETRRIMMEQWQKAGSQFRGATEELAGTWTGLTSMLSDKWFHFRNAVMESAIFDYMKAGVELFNRYLDDSGKSVDDLARAFGQDLVWAMKKVVILASILADSFHGFEIIFNSLKWVWAELSKAIWETINWLDEKLLALSQLPVFDKLFDSSKIKRFMDDSQANIYMFEQMADRASARLDELAAKGPLPAYHAAQRVIAELDQIVQKAKEAKAAAEVAGGGIGGVDAEAARQNAAMMEYFNETERARIYQQNQEWDAMEMERMNATLENQRQLKEQFRQGEIIAEANAAAERARIETEVQEQKRSLMASGINNAVDLLQVLGAQSKAAAIAALVVQKGLAIAQTFIAGKAAEIRALAELGPIAGPPMAAAIATWTKINMALIAATGLAQAMSLGASPPAAGGTAGEPLPQRERMTAYEKETYGSGWRPGEGQQIYQPILVVNARDIVTLDSTEFQEKVATPVANEISDPNSPLARKIRELT
jgi:hypothetical protein